MDEYLNLLSEIQNLLLKYLDVEVDEVNKEETNFKNLIQFLTDKEILVNKNSLKIFLQMIVVNSNNYFRKNHFYSKIDLILSSIKTFISQNYSNEEIYEIFQSNPRLLLYFLEEKIFYFDSEMEKQIKKNYNSRHFFQKYIQNTDEVTIHIKAKEKYQKEGENELEIAEIIRNDKLDDFIQFIANNKISINSDIEESIYETNEFFKNHLFPRYIEYAAFYGSIQIFKYLCVNEAQFHPIIWKCAIHGRNYEIIHFIENNENFTYKYDENDDIEGNLKEAIKCHHNEIAFYYYNNFCSDLDIDLNIIKECFDSYNIAFLNDHFKEQFIDALNSNSQNIIDFMVANDYSDFISLLLNDPKIKYKPVFYFK